MRRGHRLSTRAVQAARVLNFTPDQRWVDWAERMLVEGTDTPGLRIMAGLLPPFSSFEVTQLLDRVLDELGVSAMSGDEALAAYAHDLVSGLLDDPQSTDKVLQELSQLCIAADYASMLMPFYLLCHARLDWAVYEYQHYWAGADRSNIDQVVRDKAQRWLHERAA